MLSGSQKRKKGQKIKEKNLIQQKLAGTKETIVWIQMNKTTRHKGKLDDKIHENLIQTMSILLTVNLLHIRHL